MSHAPARRAATTDEVKSTFRPTRPAMKLSLLAALLVLSTVNAGLPSLSGAEPFLVKVVQSPDTAAANPFCVGNRPPLKPSPFLKLPIGSITPNGWLRHQLQLEANGMT